MEINTDINRNMLAICLETMSLFCRDEHNSIFEQVLICFDDGALKHCLTHRSTFRYLEYFHTQAMD